MLVCFKKIGIANLNQDSSGTINSQLSYFRCIIQHVNKPKIKFHLMTLFHKLHKISLRIVALVMKNGCYQIIGHPNRSDFLLILKIKLPSIYLIKNHNLHII